MDLTRAEWRKSSRSGTNGGTCVEVAAVGGRMAVRDSKNRAGPKLGFTRGQWAVFVARVKAGEHDR